ncbi:MAG: MBOAT family O-acyltransferase [Solirubrobacterales bacterium]
MLFNSYQFLFLFLPVALGGCFLLAQLARPGLAMNWLIACSLVFYANWTLVHLPLLLVSIGFNYAVARLIAAREDPTLRRLLLMGAAVVDIGLLGYYKYLGFLVSMVNAWAGTNLTVEEGVLPLGISFYTFQQLSLLADVAAGTAGRMRFRDFVLFVTFFPHLIAGPIVHHREMMPQFQKAEFRLDWGNLAVGFSLFAIGLFKKAVLADGLALHVSPIFADAAAGKPISMVYAWAAAVGFTLQMYFDFSGYSEMALGLGRMVGIRLPMNFNSPLKATSIIAFWSRWHITLTRFLTTYVFNKLALAMSRRRRARGKPGLAGQATSVGAFASILAMPTLVTMFLSGIWHGAGYQFVVFGAMHGVFLVVNHAWRLVRPRFWRDQAHYQRVMAPVGLVMTFVAATTGMTVFHAASMDAAFNMLGGMVGLNGVALPDAIPTRLPEVAAVLSWGGIAFDTSSMTALLELGLWVAALLPIVLFCPNALEIMADYDPAIALGAPKAGRLAWYPSVRWASASAALMAGGVFALNRVSEFLYWQF